MTPEELIDHADVIRQYAEAVKNGSSVTLQTRYRDSGYRGGNDKWDDYTWTCPWFSMVFEWRIKGADMTPDELIAHADLIREYAESVKEGNPIELQSRHRELKSAWIDDTKPLFNLVYYEYRKKPAPREPLRLWVNVYPDQVDNAFHLTLESANSCATGSRLRCAEMVEVLKEEKT